MIAKDAIFAAVAAGQPITPKEVQFLCQLADPFACRRALERRDREPSDLASEKRRELDDLRREG